MHRHRAHTRRNDDRNGRGDGVSAALGCSLPSRNRIPHARTGGPVRTGGFLARAGGILVRTGGLLAVAAVVLIAGLLVGCTQDDPDVATTAVDSTSSTESPPTSESSTTTDSSTTTSGENGRSQVTRPPTQAERLSPESGPFGNCSHCHSLLDRPGGLSPELVASFGHEQHLSRGADCESCHKPPVHTQAGTETPRMVDCYSCHGDSPEAAAPRDCALCHPAEFDLVPASHTEQFFGPGHSQVVQSQGTDECFFLCHDGDEESFCQACHGLEIPHPAGWVYPEPGEPGNHVAAAHEEGAVCVKCHGNTVDPPRTCYGGECHGS